MPVIEYVISHENIRVSSYPQWYTDALNSKHNTNGKEEGNGSTVPIRT